MARYALINPQDGLDRLSSNVDPDVQTKAGFRWLPCDPVDKPSIDEATEIVTGPTYTVGASSVTEAWSKRNLTAQELSDKKDDAVNGLNGGLSPLLKALLNIHNRIRALEGQSPHTMAQFKNALKALL